jgi:hypothetical protein
MGQLISTDIRDQLRRDHDSALAELEALRAESDAERCLAMLGRLRRTWVIHALAEETVVYHALESAEHATASGLRADDRFVEHERVESAFEELSRSRPGTPEWRSRVDSVRELILHHICTERDDMFAQLARRFDATARAGMGERFGLARDKLTVLEEAKAHRARGGEARPGASSSLQ